MRARSALFDVYGGYLRARGGSAAIAALVRLLEPLGFGAPAIRTAVSRMVRQGWLEPVRLAEGPGYALTRRAERRLDEAAARIYRTRPSTWDGRWQVLVLAEPPTRGDRERLDSSLRLLGYAPLGPTTWIAPRISPELADLLAAEDVAASTFHGPHEGADAELAARAWNLEALGAEYAAFVEEWAAELSAVDGSAPAEAFAASQRLLHAWRRFLFRDPGLPAELLPPDWPGTRAAAFFDRQTARLAPAAEEFLDRCLRPPAPHPIDRVSPHNQRKRTLTDTAPLVIDDADGVRTLTLNRPDAFNSLTLRLKEDLLAALRDAAADAGVRAVVLTGAGRAFCAGQDLKEHVALLRASDPAPLSTVSAHYNPIISTVTGMPKPVIAAVNGMAAGAGASLAYACDLRIAAASAKFLMAFANVGLTADSGASFTLPRLIGYGRAMEMMLLAAPVPAEQALAIGMVTQVVADDSVLPTAQELAKRMAAGPTTAYGKIKEAFLAAAAGTLDDALATEARTQAEAGATADHLEAVDAFVAKRTPTFTGR